ncbi:apolipoprotein L1 [Homo sapiens]|uniref:Apolipoprotein L1 n=6 Tax=Homo sapiens TaxID=9606 RepID=APOL1_HUMAN|nr:apolipoprotein L1 isoform a precursor [Homo sapiens]NP_003652.2 apolipoprotein L1 isoform a precursor [Homo sapiens]O14791.5 RecName: Full=Apolipoprotein L1; AltName: Full=Apolipoprotein L; Short=Apo-L; Short=ApoL; AltName: Full=Apolipoprotein L-I; Short=ApoL-I; Flags: Precursor [Homo sapiens]AAI43040.1 APOL1 protein [Homo sapiens]KAI4002774.1 apolipoprotein L1 [Homo sapiens]KAI4002778.1 apolipoprotein L1 [Homo sapiens]KAI4002782.1 apolipoprotein L1 [Homo sapiens]|eukprot:NP_001130012.1 apolipoprotein L1 isoform a precursor [Homo sapiens]
MEGAALLRVSVLCIWMSALFLGVGVRAEEAGARVQQNVPSGTDTGDPQSKPLGDWAAGTMDPESSIFIEDAIKYFKEKVSTQNLLLLLTDNEAWNGFVAAAELPRNEADELRKALDNLARQMIMKDKNWHDKGQQYRNWFLKEFPRLKSELEDNIRRLRALADGVQKVHKGTTIANVVSGSLSISSGILTLVGMGLAPFTEGGSLVLLEPGMELGITAALTGITSSTMDYGKKWWTQAQAHDLVIKSLDKLKEVREFLGENISNFLSLAGNTYQLTRGIGKDIRALRRARANLQSVPHASASRPRVTEPISAESGEQVERVNEPSILEMSRGVKLTDVAPVSFFLVLDVVYLVYESKHLHEGAKSETAEELKKVAQELEEKLNILNNNYKILQADQEL